MICDTIIILDVSMTRLSASRNQDKVHHMTIADEYALRKCCIRIRSNLLFCMYDTLGFTIQSI